MIQFEFTPKDFEAFNNYYINNHASVFIKYYRYFYLLIIAILLFNLRELLFMKEFWAITNITAMLPLLFIVALVFFLFKRRNLFTKRAVNAFVKKNPQAFGRQEITLTEDKLTVQREGQKSEHSYSSFLGRAEDPNYYFLFINTNSQL